MKVIYTAVMAQLKEQVEELKWIDLDRGQLDYSAGDRPPVAFPAVLIGIALPRCETLYGKVQHCQATVTVRIAQNPPVSRTAAGAPADVRENALQCYDLIERIHAVLQDFGTPAFNELSRIRQKKETRADGLFVYEIEYATEFRNDPDEPPLQS
jgi:hypothetical protein